MWRAGGPVQRVGSCPKRDQCPKAQYLPSTRPHSPSYIWFLPELGPVLANRPGVWFCVCLMEHCPPMSHSQIFLHLHPTLAGSCS